MTETQTAEQAILGRAKAMALDFHIRARQMTIDEINDYFKGEQVESLTQTIRTALALAAAEGALRGLEEADDLLPAIADGRGAIRQRGDAIEAEVERLRAKLEER